MSTYDDWISTPPDDDDPRYLERGEDQPDSLRGYTASDCEAKDDYIEVTTASDCWPVFVRCREG